MRVVGRQQTQSPMPHMSAPVPAQGPGVDLSGVFTRLAECEKNIAALAQANNALVTENTKLKQVVGTALANYKSHFNGLVRTLKVRYTPDPVPAAPQPARPVSRSAAPSAQVVDAVVTPSATPAGPSQTPAQQVADNANALFYGAGDAAFFEGGEND